jgi:hypothetical protein
MASMSATLDLTVSVEYFASQNDGPRKVTSFFQNGALSLSTVLLNTRFRKVPGVFESATQCAVSSSRKSHR